MRELVEDIKIIFDKKIATNEVPVSINNGTQKLSSELIDQHGYLPNSYIPNGTWRWLNQSESSILIAPVDQIEEWTLGGYIGIIKISDSLINPLRNQLKIDSSSIKNISLESVQTDYHSIIEDISSYLQAYQLFSDEINCLGIQRHPPGLMTSTVDRIRYLPKLPRVGLHLDSWQNAPLRRRHLSKNRVCINIGRETRYFLFINLSVLKMAQLLGLSTATDFAQYYRGIEIPDKFMNAFPDYPVVKLALGPNMAYIAPTENMIHDATSMEKVEPDFSVTFLGRFGIKNT